MQNVRLIRRAEVLKRLGIGGTLFDEMIKAGQAPAPVRLGKRCVAWVESEITALIETRIAERDAAKTSKTTA